jgi:hypothetical protein
MFEVTCLGHHSFLFTSDGASILVDPVLRNNMGFTRAIGLIPWPARELDLPSFPTIDAVFLTHEHQGHVDFPSLHLIDRRVPIHCSARSSIALVSALREMGFTVHRMRPGDEIVAGPLRLHVLTADQNHAPIEEWDVLPYLVYDVGGHGSFFTSVDMKQDPRCIGRVQQLVERPGIWAYTDNHHDYACCATWPADSSALRDRAATICRDEERLHEQWSAPALALLVGGGWAFEGEQAWLNRNVFLHGPAEMLAALRLLLPHRPIEAARPGMVIRMRGGEVVEIARAPFVRCEGELPSRQWKNDVPFLESYGPASGRTTLGEDEAQRLLQELQGFAAALYGGPLFRSLLSLDETIEHKPTWALVLQDGDAAFVLEYDPSACAFVPVDEADPVATYLAVFECWAADLLDTFEVRMSQDAIGLGRHRIFCHDLSIDCGMNQALFTYVHPLRFPDRFLAFYRQLIEELPDLPDMAPVIRRSGT